MRIHTTQDGETLIWSLSGSFSFASYSAFDDVLAELSGRMADGLRIDVSGVTFLDSAAAWMLMSLRQEAENLGLGFHITGAQGEVRHVLEMARLGNAATAILDPSDLEDAQDVTLLCEKPPCAEIRRQCSDFGLRAALKGEGDAGPGHAAILYGAACTESIAAGLAIPLAGFIESSADHINRVHPRGLQAARRGGFTLSLSTRSACRIELSLQLEHAVRQRFPLGRRDGDDMIALCMAEAVSNAVIHGNLGISSDLRQSSEGFRLFRQLMNDRLSDPGLAARRVTISLEPFKQSSFLIAVSDEGQGFDIGQHLSKALDPAAKFGRGLAMIRKVARAVWAEDGGRTLVMSF